MVLSNRAPSVNSGRFSSESLESDLAGENDSDKIRYWRAHQRSENKPKEICDGCEQLMYSGK